MKSREIELGLIVAMAENRVIGRDNQLPWHLPEDLKYFKRVTMGRPIIMGRKTYDSIGRALPGRTNIVVTAQKEWSAPGVTVAHSLDEALAVGRAVASGSGVEEVLIIGGEALFRKALSQANRLYLTLVHADVPGDTFFPALDLAEWRERERAHHAPDELNPYAYSFLVLERERH